VRRLNHAVTPTDDPACDPDAWRTTGTVIVTGGTGGLGAHVARWAARQGAAHVVLASRRGDTAPGAAELRDELTALGTGVTLARCDVSRRDELVRLFTDVPAEHPVTAVIHTAAVLDDGIVASLTPERLATVAAAKCAAAEHLDELTRDLDLDAFVLFSSFAGTSGNAGQAAYGAANAHLDALAERRRAQGRPATSIAWGAWRAGLPTDNERAQQRLRRGGMIAMEADHAVDAMRRAVARGDTGIVVAHVDWDRFVPAFTAVRPSALIADLPEVVALREREARAEPESGAPADERAQRWSALTAAQRAAELLDLVRTCAATVLGYAGPDEVPAARPLRDLGLD